MQLRFPSLSLPFLRQRERLMHFGRRAQSEHYYIGCPRIASSAMIRLFLALDVEYHATNRVIIRDKFPLPISLANVNNA